MGRTSELYEHRFVCCATPSSEGADALRVSLQARLRDDGDSRYVEVIVCDVRCEGGFTFDIPSRWLRREYGDVVCVDAPRPGYVVRLVSQIRVGCTNSWDVVGNLEIDAEVAADRVACRRDFDLMKHRIRLLTG